MSHRGVWVRAAPASRTPQAGAGIEIHAVPGDKITKGQKLFTLHTDTPDRFDRALDSLRGGYTIDPQAAEGTGARDDVVLDRIS